MFNKFYSKYSRNGLIKIAGGAGITLNLLISALKLIIGMLANSVAIISDSVNNLTDAMSSVVTLVGLKLSGRQPDRKHPLGYGRIEYLSSMAIAVIVSIAGFEFLKTSVERIMNPETVNFSIIQLIVLAITILIKLFLSKLNIAFGKAAKSSALEASGAEARIDVLVSLLTIITAIIAKMTGWQLDGYVGVLLSVFILYTGIKLIKETISQLIGERPEKELVDEIRSDLAKYDNIQGAFDFIIHSYGPVVRLGTANLEFSDTMTANDIYYAMQTAQKEIYNKHSIYFTFGLYAVNTYDTEVSEIKAKVKMLLKELPYIIGIHAFFLDKEQKIIEFDVVVSFDMQNFKQAIEEINDLLKKEYPDYKVNARIDLDYA